MSGDDDDETNEERLWEPDDRGSGDATAGLDLEGSDLEPEAEETPMETGDDEEESPPLYTAAGLRERLTRTRESAELRQVRTVQASLLGLVILTFHPVGLLLGGVLVGIPQRTVRLGLLAGLAYGLLALVVFVPWLGWPGAVGVTTGQPVTMAIPVLGALVGSLVRVVS